MRFSPIFSLAVCTPVSGNTFGLLFTVTSFGESHGPALGCIADGCPPGLALTEADIQRDLERRRPGRSAIPASVGSRTKCVFCPESLRERPLAHRSCCWLRIRISAPRTMPRFGSCCARTTPTTPTCKSMDGGITGAAVAPLPGRPSPGWRRGRLPASTWSSNAASRCGAAW